MQTTFAHSLVFWNRLKRYSASTQKSINSKSVTNVSIMGIMLTPKEVPPLGVLGYKLWPPAADTATAQGIGGVRSSHGVWPQRGQTLGPERVSAEPRKARFFAKQKMRPNEVM
jgi:hypothetical protein